MVFPALFWFYIWWEVALNRGGTINSSYNPITEGRLRKALFAFFLPIFFSSLVQQSYSIIDALIVGNYAGKQALAAVDSTYVIIKLLINVFVAVAAGASILIARYYGAKDEEELKKTLSTLLVFSFFGGLVITFVGTIFSSLFVSWMRVPLDIFDKSVAYLRIYFCGSLFSLCFNICSGILRSVGDSKRPFHYMLTASAANIILDIVFVAFLKMDVEGVALATLLAQLLSTVLILRYLLKTNFSYSIKLKALHFHRGALNNILKTGLPLGAQTLLYAISNMYMQGAINSYGTDGIAAWAICGKLDFLIWTIVDTMGITVTTFIAQNIGAKKYDRVDKILPEALLFTLPLITVISLILYFFSPVLASFFNKDGAVLTSLARIMSQIAPFYVLYIGGELLSGAIRGRGETFKPMILTLIGTCLFRIFWVQFVLPLSPSFSLLMWGYPASWFATGLLFAFYYRFFIMSLKV